MFTTSPDAIDAALPARRLRCSGDLGWRNVIARTYQDRPRAEAFSTVPSSALLVVLVTGGDYSIESRGEGRWRRADYHPGAVGVSAPGTSSRLRWRSRGEERMTSLHLYLCPDLVEQTRSELGRTSQLPDALLLDDPVLAVLGGAIGGALARRAPAMYADGVAQALAVRLLRGQGAAGNDKEFALGRSTLGVVVGYLRDHVAEDVTLDDLALRVGLSKFHLLRMFKRSTGSTPHRYLVQLRLVRAANLLRDRRMSVSEVALACGYQSPSQFSATFRRAYGMSPRRYRALDF